MENQHERVVSFNCSNCGCIILDCVKMTQNSRVRVSDFYCKTCYYSVVQKNLQLRRRLEYMKDKRIQTFEGED